MQARPPHSSLSFSRTRVCRNSRVLPAASQPFSTQLVAVGPGHAWKAVLGSTRERLWHQVVTGDSLVARAEGWEEKQGHQVFTLGPARQVSLPPAVTSHQGRPRRCPRDSLLSAAEKLPEQGCLPSTVRLCLQLGPLPEGRRYTEGELQLLLQPVAGDCPLFDLRFHLPQNLCDHKQKGEWWKFLPDI